MVNFVDIPGIDKSLLGELREKFAAREPDYFNSYPARTGETGALDENPTAGLQAGYIWTRRSIVDDSSGSEIVARAAVPAINLVRSDVPNAPVKCGYTKPGMGGELVAYSVRATTETVYQYGYYLAAMGTPVPPAELNNQTIPARLLLDGLVTKSPTSGALNIAIQPFGAFPGVDPYDIASSEPGTPGERRWVIVSVDESLNTGDPADSVSIVDGDVSTVPRDLFLDTRTEAEAIQVPAGYTRLAAVMLENGQAVIDDNAVLDLRQHYGVTGQLLSEAAETLTIASGSVTATGNSYFLLAAESGTADDLDTVVMSGVPRMILLQADAGDTITVKTGTGNIELNAGVDFALSGDKTLALFWNGSVLSDVAPTTPSSGATITVDDGVTTLTGIDTLNFTSGATVSAGSPANVADIAITGGGGGALTRFDQQIAGVGGQAYFEFTSIPNTGTDLLLSFTGRTTNGANQNLLLRLGTGGTLDTGNNYNYELVQGNVSTASASQSTAQAQAAVGAVPGTGVTANWQSRVTLELTNYALGSLFRTFSAKGFYPSASTTLLNLNYEGLWANTGAIDILRIYPGAGDFVEGSIATLWIRT